MPVFSIDRLPRWFAKILMYLLLALPMVLVYLLVLLLTGSVYAHLLLILIIIFDLIMGYYARQSFDIAYDYRQRHSEDISEENRRMPKILKKPIQKLWDLGFERLGETLTHIPGLREINRIEWILKNPDGTINVEIVYLNAEDLPYMVQFVSNWQNHATLETMYPIGNFVDKPTLRSIAVSNDVTSAYHVHLRQMADFSHRHGEPISISTMNDWMAREIVYRKIIGYQKIFPAFINGLAIIGVIGCGSLAGFVGLILLFNVRAYAVTGNTIISLIIIAIVSFILANFLIPKGANANQKKNAS